MVITKATVGTLTTMVLHGRLVPVYLTQLTVIWLWIWVTDMSSWVNSHPRRSVLTLLHISFTQVQNIHSRSDTLCDKKSGDCRIFYLYKTHVCRNRYKPL